MTDRVPIPARVWGENMRQYPEEDGKKAALRRGRPRGRAPEARVLLCGVRTTVGTLRRYPAHETQRPEQGVAGCALLRGGERPF